MRPRAGVCLLSRREAEVGGRGGGGDHHIAGQFIQLAVHTGARGGGARRGRHHENSVMVLLQSIY